MSDRGSADEGDNGREAALRLLAEVADKKKRDMEGREKAAAELLADLVALGDKQQRPDMRFDFKERDGGVVVYFPQVQGPGAKRDQVFVEYTGGVFMVGPDGGELGVRELAYDPHRRTFVAAPPKNERDVPRAPLVELVHEILKTAGYVDDEFFFV